MMFDFVLTVKGLTSGANSAASIVNPSRDMEETTYHNHRLKSAMVSDLTH